MTIECLNCGETRRAERGGLHRIDLGNCCPRCGYVGWAETSELSESTRRALRERPVARRRLVSVS